MGASRSPVPVRQLQKWGCFNAFTAFPMAGKRCRTPILCPEGQVRVLLKSHQPSHVHRIWRFWVYFWSPNLRKHALCYKKGRTCVFPQLLRSPEYAASTREKRHPSAHLVLLRLLIHHSFVKCEEHKWDWVKIMASFIQNE